LTSGPSLRYLGVDVRSRGVCAALVQHLASPVVRVRRLDVRAARLAAAEKLDLFAAVARLRSQAAMIRSVSSSSNVCDLTKAGFIPWLPLIHLVGWLASLSATETVQVELKRGRAEAPAVRSTGLIQPTSRTWIACGHFTHEIPPRPTYPTDPNFSLRGARDHISWLECPYAKMKSNFGLVWKAA
jgi:hypothetical protein